MVRLCVWNCMIDVILLDEEQSYDSREISKNDFLYL